MYMFDCGYWYAPYPYPLDDDLHDDLPPPEGEYELPIDGEAEEVDNGQPEV